MCDAFFPDIWPCQRGYPAVICRLWPRPEVILSRSETRFGGLFLHEAWTCLPCIWPGGELKLPAVLFVFQVSEMAVSELPGNPNAVWTVKTHEDGEFGVLFEVKWSSNLTNGERCHVLLNECEPKQTFVDFELFKSKAFLWCCSSCLE